MTIRPRKSIQRSDQVFVRDFRKPKTWFCGTIVKRITPGSEEIQLVDGQTIRRYINHLRIRATTTEERRTDAVDDILPPVRVIPFLTL